MTNILPHQTTGQFSKCLCTWCQNPIEFETARAGEGVACPHCGKETPLRIPLAMPPVGDPDAIEPERRTVYPAHLLGQAKSPQQRNRWLTFVGGLFVILCLIGGFKYMPDIMGPFVAFLVAMFFYFIPSIVGREKRNASAIMVLNIFLGWTIIGWVVALVWASMKEDGQR